MLCTPCKANAHHPGARRNIDLTTACTCECMVTRIATLAELEKAAIIGALVLFSGDPERAAEALGIGVSTLYRGIKRYGLRMKQFRRTT